MPPVIALISCIIFVTGLLKIEKNNNPTASYALWVPSLWLLIMGSRPFGSWFDAAATISVEEGSVYDRFVLIMLTLLALWFFLRRKTNWSLLLKDNLFLMLLFMYLGLSVLWSDVIFVSFKRWIKIAETFVVAFVILSEKHPLQAMESVLRRCAYVLIPFSLLLIKYFPVYGIQYSFYEGARMATGVTTHKNSLGALCMLSAFFLIWAIIHKWRLGELFKNQSRNISDLLIIGIALVLLFGFGGADYSATSTFIFFVGITILLVLSWWKNLTKSVAKQLKTIMVVGIILFLLFNNFLSPVITDILGRSDTITGRTLIWSSILEVAARHSVFGTGYGGYWGINEGAYHYRVNQSHNGYIDVYLQVGAVGIAILFVFFLEFCSKIRREFNQEVDWCIFGICYLAMALLYNYSEAAFISASYTWTITVFLSVAFSKAACIERKKDQVFEIKHEPV